jgi:cytochrome oxidase assembly protein ShyY1
VDVDRLQGQIPLPLVPFSVQLIEQDPAPAALPAPAPLPEVSEGSHLSYAWQWFSFTAILLLGYPLLLRRSLRSAADADDDSG